jgi:hypothetical protein
MHCEWGAVHVAYQRDKRRISPALRVRTVGTESKRGRCGKASQAAARQVRVGRSASGGLRSAPEAQRRLLFPPARDGHVVIFVRFGLVFLPSRTGHRIGNRVPILATSAIKQRAAVSPSANAKRAWVVTSWTTPTPGSGISLQREAKCQIGRLNHPGAAPCTTAARRSRRAATSGLSAARASSAPSSICPIAAKIHRMPGSCKRPRGSV